MVGPRADFDKERKMSTSPNALTAAPAQTPDEEKRYLVVIVEPRPGEPLLAGKVVYLSTLGGIDLNSLPHSKTPSVSQSS
jgi:hypothetical protein